MSLRRVRAGVAAFLLILLFAARLLISNRSTGMASDEFAHIPAGYLHLTEHRFDFNSEHPPLIKVLSAMPLLLLKPTITDHWKHVNDWGEWFAFCSDFFFLSGEKARQLIFWARVPMILVACVLGLLIYKWSSSLFGSAAGVMSLALFTFEPNIFAHSRFVLTDIGATLVYAAFWYLVWRWLKVPSLAASLAVSLAASVSILVKHSMVVVPACWMTILIVMMASRKLTARMGLSSIGLASMLMLLVVNAGYAFHSKLFYGFVPIPEDYLRGLDIVIRHNAIGHPAYLLGNFSTAGWWYYFPLTFLVKAPIPLLLVSTAALPWFVTSFARADARTSFCLLFPPAFYIAMSMSSHINIGIRHILPLFPFLFVIGGGLFATLYIRRSRWTIFLVGLAIWLASISLTLGYDPIEYFNPLAGGPRRGWRYVADSNVDLGQNFYRLTEYIKANKLPNPNLYVVGVEYNLLEGIHYNALLPYRLNDEFRSSFPFTFDEKHEPFRPGIYAVSVAKILDAYSFTSDASASEKESATALRRLLDLEPRAKIGNFVWIYDLSAEDINKSGLWQFTFYYYDGLKYAGPHR